MISLLNELPNINEDQEIQKSILKGQGLIEKINSSIDSLQKVIRGVIYFRSVFDTNSLISDFENNFESILKKLNIDLKYISILTDNIQEILICLMTLMHDSIFEFYDKNSDDSTLNTWMFVVMDQEKVFRNDTTASDISSRKMSGESFYYQLQQDFSIYVVAPSKTSLLGGDIADAVREYRQPILKAIANYCFPSNLSDVEYQPTVYIGSEADDYIKSYYVHRFDFTAAGFVQNGDVVDYNPGTPLQLVSGTITDKNMTYTPNMRT